MCARLPAAASAETKEVHREIPLGPTGRVLVDNYKGSITVTTWEKPRVEVHARVEPDGTDADQAEKVRETDIEIEGSGGEIRIKTDYDRAKRRRFTFWGNQGTLPFVHYAIRTPRSANLEIQDYKSRIRVTALEGDLKLHTYKGSVDLGQVRTVRLDTYKGDVRARFTRFGRESEFKTYKGGISLVLPAEARFDLDADIGRRGDLDMDFDLQTRAGHRFGREADSVGETLRSRRSLNRGSVNGGGPTLRLETYKGRFRVRKG